MKMPLRVLSICAALSLGVGCFAPERVLAKSAGATISAKARKESDRLLKNALLKRERSDCVGALEDLDHSLKLVPRRSDSLFERACTNVLLNRLDEAKSDIEQFNRLYPNCAKGYSYHGFVYYLLGNRRKAAEFTQKAKRLDPRSPEVLTDSICFSLNLGQHRKALKEADELVRCFPRFANGYALKASCLSALGDDESALNLLEICLELDPSNYYGHNFKERILEKNGKYEEAVAETNAMIKKNPRFVANTVILGRLKILSGDRKGGLESFEKAISLDSATGFVEVGRFLSRRKDFSALCYVDRGLAQFPNCAELHHIRAATLSWLKNQREEVLEADRAVELEPSNSQYAAFSGSAHYLSGDRAGGILGFERAIELDPELEFPDIVTFLVSHRDPLAMNFANRAISSIPKRASLYCDRACLHSINRNWNAALRDAETALELDPQEALFANHCKVESLINLQRNEEALLAIAEYEKLIEIPSHFSSWKAERLIEKRRFIEAKATLDRVSRPISGILLMRSKVNRQLGLYNEAVADAQTAMKLDENSIARGLRESYMAHLKQGNFLAASGEFLESLVAVFTPGVKP